MSAYVIDASVVVKWVVDEAGSDQALRLRRHQLSAPDLLISECANIIWKKVRRGELSDIEASVAARLLTRADIDLIPGRRLAARAVELACLLEHSAYDCMYLALAASSVRPFVTADGHLLRKLSAEGWSTRLTAIDLAQFDD
ncbi:MAG TPA: type II toxin-antitoxin system VapC family toxin [Acetobacteraceae bacterium]